MSATIASKSLVASGWKTIAARPGLRPSSVSSVTPAVDIAKTRSGAGPLTLRLPVRTSRKPMGPLRLRPALQLRLQPLERLDALLHRRVRGEQAGDALGARREDVERAQLAGG